MLNQFTIAMAYYDNPIMLAQHIHEWRSYPEAIRNRIKFIIVDDGSPGTRASEVIRRDNAGSMLDIQCLRINVDIPWNQDGARNLAMRHVLTRWCLLTDMDHLVESDQIGKLYSMFNNNAPNEAGHYYMPMRKQQWDGVLTNPHPNSYIIRPQDFWQMGGYDEDFAGCYGSDGNFRKNMRAGLKEHMHTNVLLTQFRRQEYPDSGTNRYSRKDGPYYRANFPHLEAKRRAPAYKAVNHIRFPWTEEPV